MSTVEGYHEYTGGYSVHRGCHDKCWERSLGKQLNFYRNLEQILSILSILCCTHDIPDVLHRHYEIKLKDSTLG